MKGLSKIIGLVTVMIQLGCSLNVQADVTVTSIGLADPTLSYVDEQPFNGNDQQHHTLLKSLEVDYDLPMRPLLDNVPGWKVSATSYGHYQLAFVANANLRLTSYATPHPVFRLTDNIGVAFSIKDRQDQEIVVTQPGERYCIVTTQSDCNQFKHIADTGQIELSMNAEIYYIPKDNSAYFDPNSDEPFVESGSVILGQGVLRQKWCGLINGIFCGDINQEKVLFNLILNYSVKITPKTCYLDTSQLTQTVNMGKVAISEFKDLVGVQRGEPIHFNFHCPKAVNIEITMQAQDLNDPSNQSSYLSLSSDSTAAGVAIGLLDEKGDPIYYSPDFDSQIQKEASLHSALSPNFTYTLWPYYLKTGTVKAGTVKAATRFRFNYK